MWSVVSSVRTRSRSPSSSTSTMIGNVLTLDLVTGERLELIQIKTM